MHPLARPLDMPRLKLANRLVMPPMATAKADAEGRVTPEILAYYDEKTRGGHFGLVIVEHAFVRADGKAHRNQVSVADDAAVAGLRELARTIRANGSPCALQISHAGTATNRGVTGLRPVGPSSVRNPRKDNGLPRKLDADGIADVAKAFAAAARRAKAAGFDAVEIHGAHGYLLSQFFSPLSNRRRDAYGGSAAKRARAHLEVIRAVRRAVGKDFPVLLRFGASDYLEGGATLDDARIAAPLFEAAGVDVLDVSGGFNGYSVPDSEGVQGFFAPLTEAIKGVVSISVILTGGVKDAEAADRLLLEGKADLIGVGRAVYKDSNWAARAMSR